MALAFLNRLVLAPRSKYQPGRGEVGPVLLAAAADLGLIGSGVSITDPGTKSGERRARGAA